MITRPLFSLITLLLLAASTHAAPPRELWVYCPTNLLVDANVDKLDALWHRAHTAGYTHVLLADSKLARLDDLGSSTKHYMANLARAKLIALADHLQIIPAVFSIGYSNDLLSHNPNLAEGLPVKDSLFVVRDGQATIAADPPVRFDRLSFKDDSVQIDGNTATIQDNPGNARFVYRLKLPQFRCYHVSADVRADHYTGDSRIMALADNQTLNYANLGVKSSQDWTRHDAVFNTLDHSDIGVYFGVWGNAHGTMQWRNWRIEEVGLLNVLRRPGTPCVVKGYVEGKDYDPIVDPDMGTKPWRGEFTVCHQPPTIHTHNIRDGTQLRVSWYHPLTFNDGQVMICPSEPATMQLLTDQARLVKSAFGSTGYMMSHDEIRCLNWDPPCQQRHLDAGPILADNLRACTRMLGASTAYTWSDMFDPYHNAHDNYYLVRGNLAGSWAGLDKNVIVLNWNFEHRDQSLKFFADRGNRQIIAGYYDGDVNGIKPWLASADKVPGVIGVMYTTWANHYDDLAAFARLCNR
jgi:hypothetical protein